MGLKKDMKIDNRYVIECKIGEGGQSIVYKAKDTKDGQFVAIKVFEKEKNKKNKYIRYKNELNALKSTGSDKIIKIIDDNLGNETNEEFKYIVMEYAKHGNLTKHDYYRYDLDLCLKLLLKILYGVKEIHESNIIHRDLKPSNILLVNGEKDIKIGDFGICYFDDEKNNDENTKPSEKVGSIYFAAPEQTSSPPNPTKKSDIFSLGKILYYLITAKYDTPVEFCDSYNPISQFIESDSRNNMIDKIILKMIAYNQKDRYANIDEVIEQIKNILNIDKEEEKEYKLNDLEIIIIKFIESFEYVGVPLKEILNHTKNFFEYNQGQFDIPVVFSTWERNPLSKRIYKILENLEKNDYIKFSHGIYYESQYYI